MKKRIVSLLLSLLLLISVVPISVSAEGNYVAWIGTKGYETLDAAIKDAQDGDTIQLGEGNYATYIAESQPNYSGKNLTFEGKGNKTVWQIGAKIRIQIYSVQNIMVTTALMGAEQRKKKPLLLKI